jgi:hypothetical protein
MMAWLIVAEVRKWEAVGIDYIPAAIEAAAKRQGVGGLSYVAGDAVAAGPPRGGCAHGRFRNLK